MSRYSIYILFITMMLTACGEQNPTTQSMAGYFSLDSLLSLQISHLTRLQPSISKEAILADSVESKTLQLDSLGWEKELQVFREADIDKPAFDGSYEVRKGMMDEFSNLQYDEYDGRLKDNLVVDKVKVFYFKEIQALKKIEIEIRDKNELFQYERDLILLFDEKDQMPMLSGYTVHGKQKLRFNEEVGYEVNAIIRY